MPVAHTYPLLARPALEKNVAAISASLPEKPSKVEKKLHADIAEVYAKSALATSQPTIAATLKNGHGFTHIIKARGAVFVVDEHWDGQKQCLKLFKPLAPDQVKLKSFEGDGADAIAKIYGKKSWQDVDRIVLDVLPSKVDVYLNGERDKDLEGAWSRGVAESALAVLHRAQANTARNNDAVSTTPAGTSANTANANATKLVEALTTSSPRVAVGPTQGTDLEGAVSWRGMPVVVTSDRSGDASAHVLIEKRDAKGEGTWWPVPVPDFAQFPSRGCSVMLDNDRLIIAGGFDGENHIAGARFSVDLKDVMKPGFTAAQWRELPELPDATAWAASVVHQGEQVVVGGVAGFYLGKNKQGADAKFPRAQEGSVVGGSPKWRERSGPPMMSAGSTTVVDDDNACVFVGPSAACDGKVAVFEQRENAWFALPDLPAKVGLGQLFKRGDELVYAGGFGADGKASRAIFSIDLKDASAQWTKRGESDAVAGRARVVERDGKLVSVLVAPKGGLLVHLE